MSVRNTVFAAIEARLANIPDVASVERMPSGDPDVFPALEIRDGGQAIVETESGVTRYSLSVTIEGYVVGAGGADAHAAIGDLHAATVAALLIEPTLDGIVESIDEGDARFDVIELSAERRLGFALDLTIQFATIRGDPSQLA